jgi:hypothetical protein
LEIRSIRHDEADALGELTVRVYESIGATEDGEYAPQLRDVRGRMETCDVLVALEDGVLVGGVAYVDVICAGRSFAARRHSFLTPTPAALGLGSDVSNERARGRQACWRRRAQLPPPQRTTIPHTARG